MESVGAKCVAWVLTEAPSIVSALSSRYRQSAKMSATANEYFIKVGEGIPAQCRTEWEEEIMTAESERMSNPAAMDILGASAKNQEGIQNEELSEDSDAEVWIQMAIDHEKMQ